MGGGVHLQELLDGKMGVTLGGRKAGVTKELLDRAKVGATVEHVRRAGVTEGVRMKVGAPRPEEAMCLNHAMQGTAVEALPSWAEKHGHRILLPPLLVSEGLANGAVRFQGLHALLP